MVKLVMKNYFIHIISIASCLFYSCDKSPIESEQYKKLIYLVGAQDITKQIELEYSNEPVETFISVSSSGSLNIDKDVKVTLSNPNQIIESYNTKYFEEEDIDLFLKHINTNLYEMSNKDNLVIKAKEEIYARQPILIKTATLHPDSVHAIPVLLENVNEYEINSSLKELIILVKLKNDYSGNYGMMGTRKNLSNNALNNLQKNKTLKAISINQLRMYIADVTESNATRNSETIVLTINSDNSIIVTAWGSLQNVTGTGNFDPILKTITLNYQYTINGISYEVNESLKAD